MVHVCPRDSPRGMRQLLYRGLVTTTQVSFYVALKECATSQSRNFACWLRMYARARVLRFLVLNSFFCEMFLLK